MLFIMRKMLLTIVLIFLSILGVKAQSKVRSALSWDIERASALIRDEEVEITLSFVLINDAVERGAFVTLTPQVRWIDRTYDLTPLSVCGHDMKTAPKTGMAVMTGKPGRKVEVVSTIPYNKDMNDFSISVMLTEHRAGKEARGERRQVAIFNRKPKPQLSLETYLLEPPVQSDRQRKTVIPLRLKYAGAQDSELNLEEPVNYKAFDAFLGTCSTIIRDARTKVSLVTLSSYMSVEGDEQQNRRTAAARLKNVSSCLAHQKIFGRKKVTTGFSGEDWNSLERWFNESIWNDEESLRKIIEGNESHDIKEEKIRNEHSHIWNGMKASLFPEMERIECVMSYTVEEFSSVSELLDAYRTHPDFLSPNDYFRLLKAFEPHSYGWNEVILNCAKTWPQSWQSNINAAAMLIDIGRIHEAGIYLRRCPNNDDVKYLLAIQSLALGNEPMAQMLISQLSESRDEFRKARELIRSIEEWKENKSPWEVQLYRIGQTW